MNGYNKQAGITEVVARANGLFFSNTEKIEYTKVIEFDLSSVEPSLFGPARPQDRIPLSGMHLAFADILGCKFERDSKPAEVSTFIDESGCESRRDDACHTVANLANQ